MPSTRGAAIRLGIFAVVALVVTVTIAATIRPFGSHTATTGYRAVFTSASRLVPGDDVRVAGVAVGKVTGVSVTPDAKAEVSFTVAKDLPLLTTSRAEIRYLDLAGNRYLAVTEGDGGPQQSPRRVIGTDRTQPALDLDDLLDGFKPLLVALSPSDVNKLTLDIVRTLQGDGSTVQHLIAKTASLTTGLAERDQLINDVVQNLNGAVGSIADHHTQLEELIGQLRQLAGGLASQRTDVGAAIGHIDELTRLSTTLLARGRPSIKADIAALQAVMETLSSPTGHAEIDHALNHLPDKLRRLTATAAYGSWFNYYVCGVRIHLATGVPATDNWLTAALEQVHVVDTAKRCQS
ncbi:MCE family protein [Nocardioides marmorisolisilvae]|nr:MCE family protein [Nocardioides marmorisolisilvae]